MKLLFDKVKEIAHTARISAYALLSSQWFIKLAAFRCLSSLYTKTFYPYISTSSGEGKNRAKLPENHN